MKFGRDTDAVVFYINHGFFFIVGKRTDLDTWFWLVAYELYGVVDQVLYHLGDTYLITVYDYIVVLIFDQNVLCFELSMHNFKRGFNDFVEGISVGAFISLRQAI